MHRLLGAALAAATLAAPATAAAQTTFATGDRSAPVFESAFSLAAGDVNAGDDWYTRAGGQTRLLTSGAGLGDDYVRGTNADGTIAFFVSKAQLAPQDSDGDADLYVRTPQGVKMVAPLAASMPSVAAVAADGSRAFLKTALPLLPGESDGKEDIYEYETATGKITLRTPGTDLAVTYEDSQADGDVVFSTAEALKPGDTDSQVDVYASTADGIEIWSAGDGPHPAYFQALAEGTDRVIFKSAEDLTPDDGDAQSDLYTTTGGAGLTLVSASPNSANAAAPVTFLGADRQDGSPVVFRSTEALHADDTDATDDVYAAHAGSVDLMTPGTAGEVLVEDVSLDGEAVLLSTAEKLKATDTDTRIDMYRSSLGGGLFHVAKTNGPFDQFTGRLSPDGTFAAFETAEPITAADKDEKVDVYGLLPFGLRLVSERQEGAAGGPVDHASPEFFLADGALAFTTKERLVAADRNDVTDVYVLKNFDLALASVDAAAPETFLTAPASVGVGEAITALVKAGEQATLECRVDGGAWSPCTGTWDVGILAEGVHTLEARATDVAGNVDGEPAAATVTVGAPPATTTNTTSTTTTHTATPPADVTAPRMSGLKVRLKARRPVLSYRLDEAAALRVLVQRKKGSRWRTVATRVVAAKAGAGKTTLKRLPRRGAFRLVLTARDAAGNTSAKTKLAIRR